MTSAAKSCGVHCCGCVCIELSSAGAGVAWSCGVHCWPRMYGVCGVHCCGCVCVPCRGVKGGAGADMSSVTSLLCCGLGGGIRGTHGGCQHM